MNARSCLQFVLRLVALVLVTVVPASAQEPLRLTLEHESSLVNFEAVQQAPPVNAGQAVGLRGSAIVVLPTTTPRGLFRAGVQ